MCVASDFVDLNVFSQRLHRIDTLSKRFFSLWFSIFELWSSFTQSVQCAHVVFSQICLSLKFWSSLIFNCCFLLKTTWEVICQRYSFVFLNLNLRTLRILSFSIVSWKSPFFWEVVLFTFVFISLPYQALQLKLLSNWEKRIQTFLVHPWFLIVWKINYGRDIHWLPASQIDQRMAVFGPCKSLLEQWTWSHQDHLMSLRPIAIVTNQGHNSKVLVFSKASEFDCNIFFEIIPLQTQFFWHFWKVSFLTPGTFFLNSRSLHKQNKNLGQMKISMSSMFCQTATIGFLLGPAGAAFYCPGSNGQNGWNVWR